MLTCLVGIAIVVVVVVVVYKPGEENPGLGLRGRRLEILRKHFVVVVVGVLVVYSD